MNNTTSLNVEISNGEQGKYYKFKHIKYHIRFPLDYALSHDPEQIGCGPEKCKNCLFFGSIRGVFVGYCQNCIRDFQNTRGYPAELDYKHLTQEKFEECLPYMKGIKLEDIGDGEEDQEQENQEQEQENQEQEQENQEQEQENQEQEQENQEQEQENQEQDQEQQDVWFDDDDNWNSYEYDEDYYAPDEYGISEYERSQIPYDLRALDPRYQAQLADFRDYAR